MPNDAAQFVVGDAEDSLPWPEGTFDLIFARGPGLYNQHSMDRPAAIAVIGKDHFKSRVEAVGCEMESFDSRKVIDTTDGVPWVVASAFGWITEDDRDRRLVTGVNLSTGLMHPSRDLASFCR